MIRSSSSSEYLFIHLPVPDLYLDSHPVPCLISCQSHSLLWQCLITSATGRLCCLSTELLMQHIHKHPWGMLAEMWKKNVGVHPVAEVCMWAPKVPRKTERIRFYPPIIQTTFCMLSLCCCFSFSPFILVRRGSWNGRVAVGELKWSGRVNRVGLAQRRSVVDEGSEPGISVWAFRRSTMSLWEAPSATNSAVWPFWGENIEKGSFEKDTVVTVLILTVAVLLLLRQLDVIVNSMLHLPWYSITLYCKHHRKSWV